MRRSKAYIERQHDDSEREDGIRRVKDQAHRGRGEIRMRRRLQVGADRKHQIVLQLRHQCIRTEAARVQALLVLIEIKNRRREF